MMILFLRNESQSLLNENKTIDFIWKQFSPAFFSTIWNQKLQIWTFDSSFNLF